MNIHPHMTAESLQEHIANGPGLPRHIVSMHDFSRPMVEHCFSTASQIERAPPASYAHLARGRCMGVMFYQQSTRTRLSFESAMLRIGGHVIGFADPTTTRAVGFYEETLEDVVRFTAEMADLLVLRHTETGAAAVAASVSAVPVINAGDGYGEHPTQALGDLYHIFKHFGRIDGLTIGIVGHLGWRAHRSLVVGLSLFGVRLVVLEPPGATVPRDIETVLAQRRVPHELAENIDDVLQHADIVTTLGVHHADFHAEFGDEKKLSAKQSSPTPRDFFISADAVARLNRVVPIMHMGPIADHIDRALDSLPQAHYFKQARDGVWMRAALLSVMLSKTM
jgi:aspartate carbamoyltransferase catalytic subunit